MTTFDLSTLALFCLLTLLSLRTGFFHEISGWLGWALAALIAYLMTPIVQDPFYDKVLIQWFEDLPNYVAKTDTSHYSFTFFIIFIVAGIICSFLLRSVFKAMLYRQNAHMIGRVIGALLLGFVKTAILLCIGIVIYRYLAPILGLDIEPSLLKESLFYHYIDIAIHNFGYFFENAIE